MVVYFPKWKKPEVEGPSVQWMKSYIKRHKSKEAPGHRLEDQRIVMGTTGNVLAWFKEKYDKIDLSKYDQRMIGNCDETMLATKAKLNCIVPKSQRLAIVKEKQDKEHFIKQHL